MSSLIGAPRLRPIVAGEPAELFLDLQGHDRGILAGGLPWHRRGRDDLFSISDQLVMG